MGKRGSRFEITLSLILLLMIGPFALLTIITYQDQGDVARERAFEEAAATASLEAARQEATIASASQLVTALAEVPTLVSGGAGCAQTLASIHAEFPIYSNIFVTGPDGVLLSDGVLPCSAIPTTVVASDRDFFLGAKATGNLTVGTYAISRITGLPIVVVAYPFVNGSTFAGVVAAAIDLGSLAEDLERTANETAALLLVTDSNGTVMARSERADEFVGRPAAIRTEMLGNDEGIVAASGLDNVSRFYAFHAVNDPGGNRVAYVAVGLATHDVLDPINDAFRTKMLMFAAIAGGGLALTWVVAAATLGRNERALRLQAHLLASVGQAVVATDNSGRITYWGAGAQALYGWNSAEVMGRPIVEVTPSQTSRAQAEEIMASLAAGKAWSGEFVVSRKDGSSFTALVHDNPVLEDGRLVGVIGVSQDITAMKTATERVRFQAYLLESVSQAVVATDLEGHVTYWNPAAEKLFGWASAEAVGRPVEDLWGDTLVLSHHSDAHEESPTGDYSMRRKDGSPVLVNLGTSPLLGRNGGLEGFIAICQDVTEQRKAFESVRVSEGRLREAQGLAHLGSWEVDIATKQLRWSEEVYRIYEVDPKHFQPSFETLLTTVHPDDRSKMAEPLVAIASHDPYSIEHRILLPDGRVKHVRATGKTQFDSDNRPLRAIGTVQDITVEKLAEQARAELARKGLEVKRLEELNKMRMEFLNTAAHDLRTPLTPLKLQMAALRLKGDLDPTQKAALDLMDRNVNRFQVLVEDMLDAARLQAGKLKLRREAVALGSLVQEAVASFQEAARLGGLQVEVALQPDVRIDADPTKGMQVLMNLVSNAVKYTPKGGHVAIRVTAGEKEAEVAVQDDGLGMTSEQLGKLFQPFVRVHEGVAGVAKGTGLGLYISKGIVEQHGGRIWVESKGPGKGSTFFVAWPLVGHGPPEEPMAAT